jgi:hypothetical protein
MSAKLNDKLIQMCIERSKIQTPNKAKGTNTSIIHTVDKLDGIVDKLHQTLNSIKKLSGNIEANDEITAKVAVTDGQIHSFNALDVINIILEKSINTLDQSVDDLTHVAHQLTRTVDGSMLSRSRGPINWMMNMLNLL